MKTIFRILFALILLVSLPREAVAESANLKDRVKAAILASDLTPARRIQHFLNRVAGGNSPSRITYERFAIPKGEGIDAERSAEALAAEVVANLQELGSLDASVEAKARALYPLNGLDSDELMQAYGAEVAKGPTESARMRQRIVHEEAGAHIIHTVAEDRGLKSTLFDFWFDHFNVDGRKCSMDFPSYRDRIRTSMKGSFRELLTRVAKHPAMLIYLDNIRSVRANGTSGPNENYARELMELHTFGVGPTAGVYTQTDIQQVALILTGWGISSHENYTLGRNFLFRPTLHDKTEKTAMGIKYPRAGVPEGVAEGEALLGYLAEHPRTAWNLARKLVRKLVTEDETLTQGLRANVAGAYLTNEGSLMAMYETILASPIFWSKAAYNQKGKRPMEFVASALKLTAADTGSMNLDLVERAMIQMKHMGQDLYHFTAPTGESDRAGDWITTTNVVEAVRYGVAVANYRFPSAYNMNLFKAWEDWINTLPVSYRQGYALDGLRAYYDIENMRHRFTMSPNVDPSEAGSLLRLAIQTPDRVNGVPRHIRSAAGAFIGSKDFLKK